MQEYFEQVSIAHINLEKTSKFINKLSDAIFKDIEYSKLVN